MIRNKGYINLCEILNIPDDNYLESQDAFKQLCFKLVESKSAVITKVKAGIKLIFHFQYNGEVYYFKYDSIIEPYNELVTEEICKHLGVESISYDLASLGDIKGVISKNFKKANANYISGKDILKDYLSKYSKEQDF